jgi:hypothetical protein
MTTELKAATAEPSPWEQATLFINGTKVEWGAELVLFRGQESEVTVEAPPAIARELNLGLAGNGGLEPVASPEFGAWLAPVNGKFHWKIKPDAGKSGRISLVFFSREVVESWEHRSLVISSNLADEADVRVDGFSVPAEGNWFIRDKTQTVTLVPKSRSPLAGLPVTLTCAIKGGLDIANVVSAPVFGSEQTTYSWAVTGRTKSGTFQLALAGKGMTTPITLAISKLVSSNLADEADVRIGGVPVLAEGNWFIRGKAQTLSLIPKPGSPMDRFPIGLSCAYKSGLDYANLVCIPAFGSERFTHNWTITGNTKSGTFELSLKGRGMTTPITLAISKLISSNLSDEAELYVDGNLPPVGDVELQRGVHRTITLRAKSNSPIAGYPLMMNFNRGEITSDDVGCIPLLGRLTSSHSWRVSATNRSGRFELGVMDKAGEEVLTQLKLPCRAV